MWHVAARQDRDDKQVPRASFCWPCFLQVLEPPVWQDAAEPHCSSCSQLAPMAKMAWHFAGSRSLAQNTPSLSRQGVSGELEMPKTLNLQSSFGRHVSEHSSPTLPPGTALHTPKLS